ncbi:MAG TPA: FecR domain-containing protein [Opitutaceae bacterium]
MSAGIDQIAADWIARRYAGLTSEEERELSRWLAADPRHAAAFAELEETWTTLDAVALPPEKRVSPDPDALARPCAARRAWPWRRLLPLAAAAALAIAAVYGTRGYWAPGDLRFSEAVTTPVGSFRRVALPDGSVLRVNTDSAVKVSYSPGERRVQLLRGEAHFTVAKNPERPFLVEAGGVTVRAVGTAFNVRLRSADLEVLVTEGRVSIADPVKGESLLTAREAEATPLLVAGEVATLPLPTGAVPVRAAVRAVPPPEMERALAWQDKRIELASAPLSDFVAEFNRYNRHPIRIVDPALAARKFGGSFRADEPETFIRLLQLRFGLQVERAGDATILHDRR